eukprot:5731327-Prymnesium_polylepis.1
MSRCMLMLSTSFRFSSSAFWAAAARPLSVSCRSASSSASLAVFSSASRLRRSSRSCHIWAEHATLGRSPC